jgi:hypothetical protein
MFAALTQAHLSTTEWQMIAKTLYHSLTHKRNSMKSRSVPKKTSSARAQSQPTPTVDLDAQRRAWREQADQLAALFADESTPDAMAHHLQEGYTQTVNDVRNCIDHPEIIRAIWPLMCELNTTGQIAAPSTSPPTLTAAFERLAHAVADVIAHADAPPKLKNLLSQLYADMSTNAGSDRYYDWQAVEMRATLPTLCRLVAEKKDD